MRYIWLALWVAACTVFLPSPRLFLDSKDAFALFERCLTLKHPAFFSFPGARLACWTACCRFYCIVCWIFSHFHGFENDIFLIQLTWCVGLVVSWRLVEHIDVLEDLSTRNTLDNGEDSALRAWRRLIRRQLQAGQFQFASSPLRTSWRSARSALSRYPEHINGRIVKLDCLLPTDCTVWRRKGVVAAVGSGCLSWAVRMEYEKRRPMAHCALTARLGRWCCAFRGRHASGVLRKHRQTWQFASLSWTGPMWDDEHNMTHTRESPWLCNTDDDQTENIVHFYQHVFHPFNKHFCSYLHIFLRKMFKHKCFPVQENLHLDSLDVHSSANKEKLKITYSRLPHFTYPLQKKIRFFPSSNVWLNA